MSRQSIDSRVAELIAALHKRHPKLGHHGLREALRSEGFEIGDKELEAFMRRKKIRPEDSSRPMKWRGISRYFIAPDATRGKVMKGIFEDD